MKKYVKWICLGAVIAIVGGSLIAGIGRIFNGSFSGVIYGNGQNVGENVTESRSLEAFSKLTIEGTYMDVIIVKGDEDKVEVCFPEKMMPKITEENGELSIVQSNKKINYGISLDKQKYCKITVSSDRDIDMMLNLTSGDIDISDVAVNGTIDVTSADVSLKGIQSKKLTVNSTSGKMSFNDSKINDLSASSTSGDVTSNMLAADKISIDSVSADVELGLEGTEDEYDYNIESLSGDIEMGDTSFGRSFSTLNGRDKSIQVETISGDVDIVFDVL